MSIKIPSGTPETKAVDSAKDAADVMETVNEAAEAQKAAPVAQDAVSKIAQQVASGEISRTEAIERLMAEALDSDIVKGAPDELKAELAEVLESMLDTSPYLKSLSAALGPPDND